MVRVGVTVEVKNIYITNKQIKKKINPCKNVLMQSCPIVHKCLCAKLTFQAKIVFVQKYLRAI